MRRKMRRRRRRKTRRARRIGRFENSYVALYCRNQCFSPFLSYQTIIHGVRFCRSHKSKLRVGITPRYFTGILFLCMATPYILFMSYMHALSDLHYGPKLLVKLVDLVVGQRRTKYRLWARYQHFALILFLFMTGLEGFQQIWGWLYAIGVKSYNPLFRMVFLLYGI